MKIIGLSGGVASGKNYVADFFAKKGAAVFDADKEAHKLLELDTATIEKVRKNFPASFVGGKIDRKILGEVAFANAAKLQILEKILHPKIRQKYHECAESARKNFAKFLILNVPLLLETEGYNCDKIIAIIAGEEVQKKRFLARAGATEEKFFQIKSRQLSDAERLKASDFVIYNNGMNPVDQQLEEIWGKLLVVNF